MKNAWLPGFYLSALLQLPLSSMHILQPEYGYSRVGGRDERINTSFHFSYLSMPLLLKVKILSGIHIMAGPQFDLLISSSQKSNLGSTIITHDTEERNIGIATGVEFELSHALFFDCRYMKGFNNVGLGQRSAVTEFKWDALRLGIGVHF